MSRSKSSDVMRNGDQDVEQHLNDINVDPFKFVVGSLTPAMYAHITFFSGELESTVAILPFSQPFEYILRGNDAEDTLFCAAPVHLWTDTFSRSWQFPEYSQLLSHSVLRPNVVISSAILPCLDNSKNSLGFLARTSEKDTTSTPTQQSTQHQPLSNPHPPTSLNNDIFTSSASSHLSHQPLDINFNSNSNNNNTHNSNHNNKIRLNSDHLNNHLNGDRGSEAGLNSKQLSGNREDCKFYFYPTHVIPPNTSITCLIRVPEVPANVPLKTQHFSTKLQPETVFGSIALVHPEPDTVQISFQYIVGKTPSDNDGADDTDPPPTFKSSNNNDASEIDPTLKMSPRIDHLELMISNFNSVLNTIVDFSIAMDHVNQRRIDRIYFWDSEFAQNAIVRYWRTSNDDNEAAVQCIDPETGDISPIGRILINSDGSSPAPFSLAFTHPIYSMGSPPSRIKCVIPIPIHAVHAKLTEVDHLDIGTWQGQPFAVYLRLHSSQRLFRYHSSTPRAQWDFFNPLLSPLAKLRQERDYVRGASKIILTHYFTISGPYPTIYINDVFSTDPTFISRLFVPVSEGGFLTDIYYITNPPDSRTPSKHHKINITPRNLKQPLDIINYNGFLKITMTFTIKRSDLKPFYVEIVANGAPHYAQLLPGLLSEYTFSSQTDSAVTLDYSTHFDDYWLEYLIEEPVVVPRYDYLPLSLNFQPRLTPFQLNPANPDDPQPQCSWYFTDESGHEVTPPKPPRITIIPNPLLSSIFSPTRATPIAVSNILLPYNHTFTLRCIFSIKQSDYKPLPFGTHTRSHHNHLGLYRPLLYSQFLPPVTIEASRDSEDDLSYRDNANIPQNTHNTILKSPLQNTHNTTFNSPFSHVDRFQPTSPLPPLQLPTMTTTTTTTTISPRTTQLTTDNWTSGQFGTILSFLCYTTPLGLPHAYSLAAWLHYATKQVTEAPFYNNGNTNPGPSELSWVTQEDWRVSLVEPVNMIISFTSPSFPSSTWSTSFGDKDPVRNPSTLGNVPNAPVFGIDLLLPSVLNDDECKEMDRKLRLHAFTSTGSGLKMQYFSISAQSLVLPTYMSIHTTILPLPPKSYITNANSSQNDDVLIQNDTKKKNIGNTHNDNHDTNQDDNHSPAFPTRLNFIPHSHLSSHLFPSHSPQQSQSQQSSSSPSPSASPLASKDYVEAPLPGYSLCTVDGNCAAGFNCIKGHCAGDWDTAIYSPSEAYVASLYADRPGLPSDFNIYFAPPPPHKDSSSISLLWWTFLTALIFVVGFGVYRFKIARNRNKQSNESVLLDDLNRYSDSDDGDDGDDGDYDEDNEPDNNNNEDNQQDDGYDEDDTDDDEDDTDGNEDDEDDGAEVRI